MPENPRYYDDFTGCGNSLNLTHPRVLQMVMDSLRYWVEVCHVDGFRFDLATTLARGPERLRPQRALPHRDPAGPGAGARSSWSPSPGMSASAAIRSAAFPSQWSEWNDRYRSALRRYWSGEGSLIGEVSRPHDRARPTCSTTTAARPRASINHVTVHDGFTLADLFSYNEKHNEANGEDNRDGSNDNHSNNCGHRRPDRRSRRSLRCGGSCASNQLACLMLAQGVPLILAGDEVGNSQSGNNNAYCQDNEIGWVDWEQSRRRRRRHDRFHRPAHRLAPALSATARASLARRPPRRRLLRRAVADAGGRRDDGSGLEFSGRPLPLLCARPDASTGSAPIFIVLNAAPEDDRFQPAEDGRIQELAAGAEYRRATSRRARSSPRARRCRRRRARVLAFAGAA